MSKAKEKDENKVVEKITGGIVLTEEELTERVQTILAKAPGTLYKDEVVYNDQWRPSVTSKGRFGHHTYTTSDTNRLFLKVISQNVFERENLGVKKVDLESAHFNKIKKRAKAIENLPNKGDFIGKNLQEKFDNYCKHGKEKFASIGETRLVHCLCYNLREAKNGIKAVDYQVPPKDGAQDKIDLLLQKGNNFYITEVKTFGSCESILRCILEIETYYERLNDNFLTKYGIKSWENVKKAILIDKTAKSWEQQSEEWAEQLLKKFDIKVFVLKRDYTIGEKNK